MKKGRSYHIFASFLLLLFFVSPSSTWALTTFGKTNPQSQNQNPPPPPTPVGKARECKLESDCAGIQNTTCMADSRDGRTRCLCGDYSAPLNGACTNKFKALRTICKEDSECIEGAHCIQRNSTMPEKRCYCQEGFYEESLLVCSGSASIFTFHVTILLLILNLIKGNVSSLYSL
ncbi:oogenesis-related protein sosie [Colletes latitarsis]|uniref:oogenesis-related protein sosie n=1 Tax=Colletes latitarsis TaxID=2605962 RepID=UPI004035F1C5